MSMPQPICVIEDKDQAAVLLQGSRTQYLKLLAEPESATTLAHQLNTPRQKVNYHLRALENAGLIRLVGERKARNCTERMLQAVAQRFILSPAIIADLCDNRPINQDQYSSAHLLALAARTIRELGNIRQKANQAGKPIATLSLSADLRFKSAADRHQFAEELANAIAGLAEKYTQPNAENGRDYRLITGVYPTLHPTQEATHSQGESP